MTITVQTARDEYVGNGVTTNFAVTFEFDVAADLKVYQAGVLKTLTTHYTVSGGSGSTGTVSFLVAPAATEEVVILDDPAITQQTDYIDNDPFPAESHERALDKLTRIARRQGDKIGRSITLADADTTSASTELPVPEANKLIQWNETATELQNADPTSLATIVAFGTANADKFSGNGVTTQFVLSATPGALNNLDVSIGGVTQTPGADYTWTSGTTITFTTAPPAGTDNILVRYMQGLPQGAADAAATTVADVAGWFSAVTTKMVESVLGWIGSWLWGRDDNVFQYLSVSEIASVKAYNFAVDVTASVQNAINTAHANNRSLFAPAGGYSVTGLYLPGRVSGPTDDRGKAFRLYGQGTGEAFVVSSPRGTVFRSVTDAPVLQDYLDTDPSSNGSVELDHIRFDGTSTTPVVLLQSFFGMAYMHDCVVYQRGTGDGVKITAGATGTVERVYSMNKDWATFSLGASRVGIGFNVPVTADQGLLKISKCTSRGWLTGYSITANGGTPISYAIEHCECSVVRNGVILTGTNKAVVEKCYMEGGDGGVAITNDGSYSTIKDNLIFAGFATGIKDTLTTNKGSLIEGNIVSLDNVVNSIGIDVTSSAAFGGWNKNVVNNFIAYTLGTNGVNGIKLSGTDPRVNIMGNAFDPKTAWTGTSTLKINDTSSNGSYGITTKTNGNYEFQHLSKGSLSLFRDGAALTESNVAANNMTLPDGSYFVVTATIATTVQRFTAGTEQGRIVIFRTTNANTTFTDTAYNQLAGGVSFTGPGTITFFIDYTGGANYAYELCRTVF